MNLSSVVVLLQLVFTLLSSNPSNQNKLLASQAVSLATQVLQNPATGSQVPIVLNQPSYYNPPINFYIPPTVQTPQVQQESPVLGAKVTTPIVQPMCTITATFNGFDTGRYLTFSWTDTGSTEGTVSIYSGNGWTQEPVHLPMGQTSVDNNGIALVKGYQANFQDGASCETFFSQDQLIPNAVIGSISTSTNIYGF